MSDDGILLFDVSERVATITLNRPAARNALSSELLRALVAAVAEAESRGDVDVAILTGADPAFCAGLDLRELGTGRVHSELLTGGRRADGPSAEEAPAEEMAGTGRLLAGRAKPLIGAVNGAAVTGGLELALNCDFLLASERARFADTHARVGVMPNWGLTVLLPQAIGIRRAREMSATGNFVDADTALTWGLVNHVVPHEQLMPAARSLARDVAGNDGAGVRQILATYQEGALGTAAAGWRLEARVAGEWLRSGHGQAGDIASRRDAITSRGRTQISEG
jgi:enoyl-CoA hydratase